MVLLHVPFFVMFMQFFLKTYSPKKSVKNGGGAQAINSDCQFKCLANQSCISVFNRELALVRIKHHHCSYNALISSASLDGELVENCATVGFLRERGQLIGEWF